MTIADTAFEIANRFLDSGQKRNELELAILRHMEHHLVKAEIAEREGCAKIAEPMFQYCEFEALSVPDDNYANAPHHLEYRCRTHGMTGFNPDSTVTETGAFTLCPVGKVEFAVERGIERIEAAIRKGTSLRPQQEGSE